MGVRDDDTAVACCFVFFSYCYVLIIPLIVPEQALGLTEDTNMY
jgi:hypothetical protein